MMNTLIKRVVKLQGSLRAGVKKHQNKIRLNRLKNKLKLKSDEWCFVAPYGIGDTYYLCALAQQFLMHNGGSSVTLVVKEAHVDVVRLFPKNVKSAYVVKELTPEFYSQHYPLIPGVSFIAHPLFQKERTLYEKMLYDKGRNAQYLRVMNLLDVYRLMLNIPLDSTELSKPVISTADAVAARDYCLSLGLLKGKTVVLCPEAVSVPKLDKRFWVLLSEALNKDGWLVCSNVLNRDHLIPGSIPLKIVLGQLIPVVEHCGWIVSIRSGVCDLIATAKCRKTVIYPPDILNCRLSHMGFHGFEEHDAAANSIDELKLIKKIVRGTT